MNYNEIFNDALKHAKDPAEMKAYCIREYKKAEKEFYTKQSFYKGLSIVATDKKELIKSEIKKAERTLKDGIKNIDNFCLNSAWCNGIEELKVLEEKARSERLDNLKAELKKLQETTVYYYKKGNLTFKNIELFEQIIKELHNNEQEPQQARGKYSHLTSLQWGAVFYFVETTNLLPESKTKQTALKAFKERHKINQSFNTFRNDYYLAKRQLHKHNNYDVENLKEIIPFLKEHYSKTVARVESDITLLQEYKDEYE